MQNPTDALTEEYFQQHGIGVVMVSDMWVQSGVPPREAAANNPLLELQGSFGSWDIYTVDVPTSIATREGEVPESVAWSNQRIEMSFDAGVGPVTVRQNAFPRWQAEVNGEPADITRTADGYMEIKVPDGPAEITLEYGVTALDWAARAMSVAGVAGLVWFGWRGKPLVRSQEEVSDEQSV